MSSKDYIVVRSNRTQRLYVEECTNITLGYIKCVGHGFNPKVLSRTAYTILDLREDECFGTYEECQAYVAKQAMPVQE